MSHNIEEKAVSNDGLETQAFEEPKPLEYAHQEHAGQDVDRLKTGTITNPLAHLDRATLMDQVEEFCRTHDLAEHTEIMKRGALIAQDPDNWDIQVPDLTDLERTELQNEIDHKWRQPWKLYATIVLCSIGACVQGWDQTGSNGANLSFPQEFGIAPVEGEPDYDRNNWLVGLVNSAPYLTAVFPASFLSDPVNHYFGRRGTIFIAAIFCLAAPLGGAFTQNWHQLLVTRLLLGFGVGFKEITAPVFAAENAPANIRGALVMSWQMWTAFGIFLGNSANLVFYRVGDIAWRLQIASALVPAIPLILLVYVCPESPRWLMKRGNYRQAFNSLLKLRYTPLQAARDMYYIHVLLEAEHEMMAGRNIFNRASELFTVPRNRRASLAAFVVMIAQQMCGINIISFFSSSIFLETTGSEAKALWASFGFGLINFVFALPAVFTIDTFGRRTLLLFTFPNMFWSLLAAGMSFFVPEDNSTTRLALVALFIYIFTAFYSPGEGPVPFTYSAEVFPLSHRELGMAFAVMVNNTFAFLLSLTFFRIEAAFTIQGAFGFYAGLNLVAFAWIFLWVPETKQRTLEELDYVFAVPTKKHMKYQFSKALPYFIKRWIRFDRSARLEPLYHFDHVSTGKRNVGVAP